MNIAGDHGARRELVQRLRGAGTAVRDPLQQQCRTHLRNRELDGWQATSMLNDLAHILFFFKKKTESAAPVTGRMLKLHESERGEY